MPVAELPGGQRSQIIVIVDGIIAGIVCHWLLIANVSAGLVFAGAFVVPLLRVAGLGLAADVLHILYLTICPQRPTHSFFLFDHQMGMEQRMVAMFGAQLAGGLVYAAVGRRLLRLGWRFFLILALPNLVDIFSQTVGVRDSDGFWRVLTGTLFNLAFVWFGYPRFEAAMAPLREQPVRAAGEPAGAPGA